MSSRRLTGPNCSTAVIIPVKGENPKGRLSPLLNLRQRRQLQIAMLEDTLQTIIKARMISQTFIVSSDQQILEFVSRFGAGSIPESCDAGVSSAVLRGLEATVGFERRLVIPADLPLLTVEDLRAPPVLAREGAQVVVSPSETFDGTNALLLARDVEVPLHYDDDSFRKHFAEAVSMGLRVAVYYSKGVGFDVDRPRDLHRFFKFQRRGNTLTFLARTLRGAQSARPPAR